MAIKTLKIILFTVFLNPIFAQIQDRMSIPFIHNGEILSYPLAGGLNLPELSAVDLNNDGLLDIHLFDKIGNRQLFFERTSNEVGLNFRFAPEYQATFPPVKEWVLLRDYNGDGVMDIFAFSDQGVGGVIVYTGKYEADIIHFDRFNFNETLNLIYFPVPSSTARSQLYVSKIDYPSIDDIDCDGDLDIITFGGGGKNIQWFRNTSVESGYGMDSLIFVLEDRCWGGLYEGGSTNAVDLAPAPGECFNDFRGEILDTRHTGSTLLTFDGDNDGDRELILGDVSFPQTTYLENGGDCDEAWFNTQDSNFPSYDTPIHIPNFPAVFYLDIDNDGKKDLVGGANDVLEYSEDYEVCWFYKNTGTAENPNFHLEQKQLFVGEMIDVGTNARPVVADVNQDGLPDIIIGNESKFTTTDERVSQLVLYLNIGTPTEPSYELADDDFLNMSQFASETYAFAPCFGDLDQDGDLDIIVGDILGTLYYGENIAVGQNMMQVDNFIPNFQEIGIGFAASPQLVDANRDGLLDLLIGESSGNVNYFQNQGTAENPVFDKNEDVAPNNWLFGKIDTRIPGYSTGYSAPFIFETADGLQLITGSKNGQLEHYGAIEANFDDQFEVLDEDLGSLKEGTYTHVHLADLNNDDVLELLVGNQSGGISIFGTTFPAMDIVDTGYPKAAFTVKISPNPSSAYLRVDLPSGIKKLQVVNAQGKILLDHNTTEGSHQMALNSIPSGLYFLIIKYNGAQVIRKFIKT